MIRIMHIAQANGGVERYLHILFKKLDKKKYENILVCSQTYNLKLFQGIASYIECIEMYREINLVKDLKAILAIRRVIKKYKPDIVYMHSSKAGAISRIANFGIKNSSIYNAHGWAFNMKSSAIKLKVYALIEKMLSLLCDKIIAISDFEKDAALKWHICKEDKIEVIYNGIDFDEYNEAKQSVNLQKLGILTDSYIIGCVGRLTAQKAPDIFVKAAKLIKKKIPNSFFIMVGDGDDYNKTVSLIKELHLEGSFLITGWVHNPMEYIKLFDIAVLLSRWEGFGLVLPEFMLEGKPVVAANVDAIPNIIKDGENGILVPPDDSKAAAKAIIKIYSDKLLAEKLRKNGIFCVKERFNADRVAKEHEALFESFH